MSNLEKLSMRIGGTELRTCTKQLMLEGEHVTAEIIQWSSESCFTLASWTKGKEGFDLHFIGNRPLEYSNPTVLFKLIKVGQEYLDDYFESLQD